MFIEPDILAIGRLRVAGASRDHALLKHRTGAVLSSAGLLLSAVPASAILCIRKIVDPLPKTLRLEGYVVHPALTWQQALVAALEHAARRAAHPAHSGVPADADAVLFLDRSELLACLAADWCDGSVITRWWWQSILRGRDIMRAILGAWLEAPAYVPAALQQLAERRRVVPFMRALSPHDANDLVHAIAQLFALVELGPVLRELHEKDRLAASNNVVPGRNTDEEFRRGARSAMLGTPPGPPWRYWVPEGESHGLRFEQQCLLGIGLMLRRAPVVARMPSFAGALLRWHRGERVRDRIGALNTGVLNTPAVALPETHPEPWKEDRRLRLAGARNASGTRSRRDTRKKAKFATTGSTSGRPGRLSRAELPGADAGVRSRHQVLPSVQLETTSALEAPRECRSQEWSKQPSPPASRFSITKPAGEIVSMTGAWIETTFGGVFYLINLGIFLNLYGDFTAPLQPGIELSPWDFVALVGRKLAGKKIEADPVWPLLAGLAAREKHEAPGNNFEPPASWRVPAEWLAPFAGGRSWRWQAERNRLQVQHPEKFLLLDVPLEDGDPSDQLLRETQRYPANPDLRRSRLSLIASVRDAVGLERWLEWLMPYVRARLRRALGLEAYGDLSRSLCEHRARVLITGTHLDVFLLLQDLPIEVRFSGLDRDPGWLPAAGRFIAFHFE